MKHLEAIFKNENNFQIIEREIATAKNTVERRIVGCCPKKNRGVVHSPIDSSLYEGEALELLPVTGTKRPASGSGVV